jgi:hypothetical protein
MLPVAGREASVAVQEGRGDEPPWWRVIFPGAQSALALWLTNDRDTIPVGLRADKRPGACSHFSGQASSSARCEVAICFNRFHRPAL